jgi:hypothetical protein
VAKKSGITSGEAIQLNKGVKGTSIGNGALKIGFNEQTQTSQFQRI